MPNDYRPENPEQEPQTSSSDQRSVEKSIDVADSEERASRSQTDLDIAYSPDSHNPQIAKSKAEKTGKRREAIPWGRSLGRSWSSVLLGATSIPFAILVSTGTLLIAVNVYGKQNLLDRPVEFNEWLVELASSPYGLALLIVPGQAVFLFLALIGATCSRTPFRLRLALHSGRLPILIWPLIAIGTPTIGLAMSRLVSAMLEFLQIGTSSHLDRLSQIIVTYSDDRAFLIIGLIGLLPALSEELLFRGFVQSRLTRSWPVPIGILFASTLFAIAHVDPTQILIIFPLSIWLGIVAWRCHSTWPALLGHLANNIVSIVGVQWTSAGMEESRFFQIAILTTAPFFVIAIGLMVAIPLGPRNRRPAVAEET